MATETAIEVERLEAFSAGFSGSVVDPLLGRIAALLVDQLLAALILRRT